ncbi:ATPase [Prochlorococcus marinus str. NATL1A]|uniref:ATPase n=1 Tax=Prochlorococcus marinus (strain NATL1A) TaxID=167555 RepID=A2C597_PROM1|nr:ABC transporter transmembrane domain-containing protein [Prochlorococcus marinus]ABM76657.1 ATPase [Prochlorococcus marinus str. NATL1A]
MLEGNARLITENNNQSTTICKFSPGSFIGISSLLRGEGYEEVSAIENSQALAIPAKEIVQLYLNEKTFQDFCNSYFEPSEALSICEKFIKNSPRSDINLKSACYSIFKKCKLFTINHSNEIIRIKDKKYILTSANVENKKISETINEGENLKIREPFPARVLEIDIDLYESFYSLTNPAVQEKKNSSKPKNTFIEELEAPDNPEISNINVGQIDNNKKFEIIRASGYVQEVLACMKMLCRELKIPFRKDTIEKILRSALSGGKEPTMELCGAISSMLGLNATGLRLDASAGVRLRVPSLIKIENSFGLIKESNSNGLVIASPSKGLLKIKSSELSSYFEDGIDVILLDKKNTTPDQNFGIGWFIPALKKHKRVLIQVLIASFVVQLFTLANPLLIQVIIDKVISQRSLATLEVLGIALFVVTILGGVIGSLRTFLFTETTNRIDTTLGAEVIDHLLRLPLNYFDKRPVGELGTRVSELEKIRNFLTGQALTTILDAIFSVIYIIVMVMYSWLLTFIALAVVPIQIALTLIGAPLIRRQIRELAEENAKTQSHLVEVLTGVQTVKAQNVEIVSRWKWQDFYHKYIQKTFERTITGTSLSEISKVLQNLSQLLVLWVGASLVLKGQLTLGQLIAFRIISSYVTQPLLRLSNIWQEIQQLRVSFERLADIIDTPEESNEFDKANIPMPNIKGKVSFENVTFSFDSGKENVIKNISQEIPSGKFVGIVGQSGSGKSTLMKLLPRLYELKKGKILIDGYDISKTELYSLRRQIGIVPQEPLLFSGSVSENIALTDPNADSDDIVNAAKIADAHNFIMTLPMGYSTNVGERGAALSGGQKQRIAIARTILNKPRLLIMDEATSALDYSTERRVCENLKEYCSGSTVFFITHRLTTIKNADMILMLDKGIIAETGNHNELMSKKGRYYALYQQQGES